MGLINTGIIVSMLIVALRRFREQNENGLLSFGNAFLIGLFVCLISGAIWSIYRLVEYSLDPNIIKELLLVIEEKLLESSMNEDQIESMMKLYTMFYTALFLAFSTFAINMGFGGAILSLILAAIFKREGNATLTNSNR